MTWHWLCHTTCIAITWALIRCLLLLQASYSFYNLSENNNFGEDSTSFHQAVLEYYTLKHQQKVKWVTTSIEFKRVKAFLKDAREKQQEDRIISEQAKKTKKKKGRGLH